MKDREECLVTTLFLVRVKKTRFSMVIQDTRLNSTHYKAG